jgi:hypothetical protein
MSIATPYVISYDHKRIVHERFSRKVLSLQKQHTFGIVLIAYSWKLRRKVAVGFEHPLLLTAGPPLMHGFEVYLPLLTDAQVNLRTRRRCELAGISPLLQGYFRRLT